MVMQVSLDTIITIIVLVVAVATQFVWMKANQKQIISRLDRINGRIYNAERELSEHVKEFHSKR